MKIEYLIFNIIIFLGPLSLSFEKGVRYYQQWKYAFLSMVIVAIPYLIWDSLVSGHHWWFNQDYTLDYRLAGLPLEEIMFFFSVPFAVLFIWEIFYRKTGNPISKSLKTIGYWLPLFILPGIIFWFQGKEYTGMVLMALGAIGITDLILKTDILARKNTYIYLVIVASLNMIFNGYLTARPVVIYNEAYQLGWRIFTIPLEDFIYGFSLILFNTILHQKFKELRNGN